MPQNIVPRLSVLVLPNSGPLYWSGFNLEFEHGQFGHYCCAVLTNHDSILTQAKQCLYFVTTSYFGYARASNSQSKLNCNNISPPILTLTKCPRSDGPDKNQENQSYGSPTANRVQQFLFHPVCESQQIYINQSCQFFANFSDRIPIFCHQLFDTSTTHDHTFSFLSIGAKSILRANHLLDVAQTTRRMSSSAAVHSQLPR